MAVRLPRCSADRPRRVSLLTKGWLPYTLRWEALTTESKPPHLLSIEAFGDFSGRGIWSIVRDDDADDGADNAATSVTFDWKIGANKPLLRNLSFLFRPAFEANHRWAMEQGRQCLERELKRRRND